MATSPVTGVDDSAKKLQRSLDNLTRSLDDASNKAVDKAAESITELLLQTQLLTKEQKKAVGNIKGVTEVLAKLKERSTRYAQMQDQLTKKYIKFDDALEEFMDGLDDAGKRAAKAQIKNSKDLKEAIDAEIAAINGLNEAIDKETRELQKLSNRFGKELDKGRSKLIEHTTRIATFGFAAKKAAEGLKLLYQTGVKLSNRGMINSMGQLTTSALMLRMGTEEFIELVEKNRDTIMALGGGAKGVEAFEDKIRAASEGLAYMGKDGKKAIGQWMGAFIRTGGTADEYVKSSKMLNANFKTLQETVGTTVEEFQEYLEEINNGQMIQAKLNMGDKQAATQLRQEALARTEQYAALQLTTKQMVAMNKTLEAMYNPQKNRQAEVLRQRAFAKLAVSSTSGSMRKDGRTADADILDQASKDGSLDAVLKNPSQAAKDPKYAPLLRALDNMRSYNTEARGGDDASMKNYLGVEMADRSQILQGLQSVGSEYNKADLARGKNQGQKYADQKANANQDGLMKDAWTATRTAVEAVTAVMNTAFTPALLGATAALMAMIGPARLLAMGGSLGKGVAGAAGKAGGAIKGIAGRVAGAAASAGGGIAGAARVAAPLLGSAGAVAGAGLAGYYGTKGAMSLAGVDPGKLGTGLYDLLHDDPMKPRTSRPMTGRSGIPVKPAVGIMPKAAGTAKANEAVMEKALTDAGITDPKQKAILMGQLAHESGGFKYTKELASGRAYEGRKDLGNTQEGDGMRYKGRGFIQLTGRANYAAAGRALGLDLTNNPELAEQPEIAAKIAIWYMQTRKNRSGSSVMDMAKAGDVNSVTKMINGGYNGLQDRMSRTNNYMQQYAQVDKGALTPEMPVAPTTTAAANGPMTEADLMREQNMILARIAANTTQRPAARDSAKVDKRAALGEG